MDADPSSANGAVGTEIDSTIVGGMLRLRNDVAPFTVVAITFMNRITDEGAGAVYSPLADMVPVSQAQVIAWFALAG